MIPEKLVEFLHNPVVMNVGTRDEKLHPFLNWVIGVRVNADRETITFFVHEPQSERMLRNLKENGRVALVAAEMPSHETYQFKGAYLSSRKSDDKDLALQESYRQTLISHFKQFEEMWEEYWRGIAYTPGVAVTFQIEQIFVQTPGPGAGSKIDLD
ncbi:MAG: pyridoxamine 5'-phosphate oxidase family protein [Candidatus Tectomicrobia bacterium]|nr:pyridoxamine 5'-phosphate oxidase family protein [Candidatus Tectomicrobia bacterium]